MPDAMIERATRHIIADALAATAENHPWRHLPDGYLAAPALVAYIHATASLAEYLLDVHGGVDGMAEFRAICHVTEALVPVALMPEPCVCVICDPEAGHIPSRLALDYYAPAAAAREVELVCGPIPTIRPDWDTPTQPLQIVA